jgi:hypothetical protein
MSWGDKVVSQQILTVIQCHLLKGHSKKRCSSLSSAFLEQSTVVAWQFLFFSFQQFPSVQPVMKEKPKTDLVLALEHDFHIHLKIGEASTIPIICR